MSGGRRGTRKPRLLPRANLPGPEVSPRRASLGLLQQLEDGLLHLVRLRQRRDTRLAEDLELRQVGHFLGDVSRPDTILGGGQVLHLVVHDAVGRLQAIDARTNIAAQRGHSARLRC